MREIKFRAWSNHHKRYADTVDLHQDGSWGFGIESTGIGYGYCASKYDALEQYTGLKDKNGVEIYEGDIIVDKSLSDNATYLISYCEDKAYFQSRGIDKKLNLYTHSFNWKNCEVIGNRHENPELLEDHANDK